MTARAPGREVEQFELAWRLAPRRAWQPPPEPGQWLIVGDELGYAEALAQVLQASGASTVLAIPGSTLRNPADRAELQQLLHSPPRGGRWTGVIHCGAIGGGSFSSRMTLEQLEATQAAGCASLLALAQAMATTPASSDARLVAITRGVHSVATETLAAGGIAGATAWGLARVIASEHPQTRCLRIDLDIHGGPQSQARALAAEVLDTQSDEEVALRAGGQRYVARLCAHATASSMNEVPGGTVRLEPSRAGILDELQWMPHTRRTPAPREVEIEIRATGLGFRDVLNSLGLYPGGPVPLGCECAGVVVAAGPQVTEVRAGDSVLAVAYGSLATHVTVPADWVVRMPAALSFAQAAAIPSSFTTAEHSLLNVAKIAPGQRVLIHAGAGGVGNAAIQVALRAGAEVFATASSAAKRAYLSSIGVHRTYDSRSGVFAEEILRDTAGRGVDVVLNSLADELIERSFVALADEGCFIELGKRGILSAAQAARLKPRARYVVLDLGEVAPREPELIRKILRHSVECLETGVYSAAPVTSFGATRATEAFQHMARARHIGKIVITAARPGLAAEVVRPDATYVVTGGLGALGLQVARSLVDRGARHVALIGRRAPSSEAAAEIARLQKHDVDVRVLSADVADSNALRVALEEARRQMPPIRGIVHAAGVLDDGVLAQQSWARFAQVLAPKVQGAWNLHQLTHEDSLDFFVLFSAAAGILGMPGQGAYAAANVFLDSLAAFRRSHGLTATSIDWGAWDRQGMAKSPEAIRSLSAHGLRFMSADQAMEALWQTVADDAVQRVVLPIDWRRFRERAGSAAMPLLSECFASPVVSQETAPVAPKHSRAVDLATRLAQSPKPARVRILTELVVAQVRNTIGLAADQPVDERQPLQELGLDSLMAVELRNALAAITGRTLPATIAFDYPTAEAISRHLLSLLVSEPSAVAATRGRIDKAPDVAHADIAALSDDEAAELLLQELDGVRKQ